MVLNSCHTRIAIFFFLPYDSLDQWIQLLLLFEIICICRPSRCSEPVRGDEEATRNSHRSGHRGCHAGQGE